MNDKVDKNLKIKLILVPALLALFCGSFIYFVGNELAQNQTYILRSFSSEQLLLTQTITKSISTKMMEQGFTDEQVIDLIEQAPKSGDRYWLFTKEDEILFIKSKKTTENLKDKSLENFLSDIKDNQGFQANNIINLFHAKKDGSGIFSYDSSSEKIVLSGSFLERSGIDYGVFMLTYEEYVYANTKTYKHNIYIIIAVITACIFLYSIIVLIFLLLNQKEKEILRLNQVIYEKNLIIEKITEVMSIDEPNHFNYIPYTKQNKILLLEFLKKAVLNEVYPVEILKVNGRINHQIISFAKKTDLMIEPSENVTVIVRLFAQEKNTEEFILKLEELGLTSEKILIENQIQLEKEIETLKNEIGE